jgi:aminomethyltransferase
VKFLESIIVSAVEPVKAKHVKYSLLTNERGGTIDDLVFANREDQDHIYMVINAGRVKEDLAHMKDQLARAKRKKMDVDFEFIDTDSLIAFQGPKAVTVMSRLVPDYDFTQLKFFTCDDIEICGIPTQVSRSGYTGEDGFEIAVPNESVQELTELLMKEPESALAGLGARDALRLEAGLCLYGNDLTEDISLVEADLLWTMTKKRRESGEFIGSTAIRKQIAEGVPRKRCGMKGAKGLTPRAHMKVFDKEGNEVGEVSSGSFSPCLQFPIAMAYVDTPLTEIGTQLQVEIRPDKFVDVAVCELPFVPKGYYK